MRKSSSPAGCGFFGRSGGGIDVRTTGAFSVRLFLHYVFAVQWWVIAFVDAMDVISEALCLVNGFVYVVVAFGVHACFYPGSCWNLEMTRSLVYQPFIQDTTIWGFLELVVRYHLHHAGEVGRFQNI